VKIAFEIKFYTRRNMFCTFV